LFAGSVFKLIAAPVLSQARSCTLGHTHQNFQQEHPLRSLALNFSCFFFLINFTCHHSIGDIAICIKFGQIWDRTPQMGVYKQFQPLLGPKLVQKHLQTLFLKVCHIHNFAPHHTSLKKLGQFLKWWVLLSWSWGLQVHPQQGPIWGPVWEKSSS